MKITTLILFACFMQVSAKVNAQISISDRNVPITSVLAKIQQQSGYNLFYENTKVKDVKISVNLNNVSLAEALDRVLKDQELTYALVDKTIVIKIKEPSFLDRVVDAFIPPVDVRGTVVDEKGMPLPGANVKVKGFKQAAVTDNEGRFYLSGVDDKAVLIVSFVGYKDVEVGVKGSLNVVMEMKSSELDEVVVAYGTTTERANTASLTIIKGEQIQNLPNRSFDKSLQGLVPGLLVTQGSGMPGGGLANFVLRGIATGGNSGTGSGLQSIRNPLIVVDGIPVSQEPASMGGGSSSAVNNPLSQLNPSDIESITVLKDAAAIALYGAKASNGVILVTTKKGKPGKTVFNFRHQTDLSSRLSGNQNMLNQQEYLELLYEAYKNSFPGMTDAQILADLTTTPSPVKPKFPTRADGAFYPETDWLNELYRVNASTVANEISISGGTDRQTFYLNLEYTKQNGIEKTTGFDRKSIRFNYDNRPAPWLKLGLNSALSYSVQDYGNSISEDLTSRISPLNPIRDENGDFIYTYNWGVAESANLSSNNLFYNNPIAAHQLNIARNTSYRGQSKLYAEMRFLKYFSFMPSFGVDFMLTEAKQKTHPKLAVSDVGPGVGDVTGQDIKFASLINTNTLRYDRLFNNKHSLNILLGHEAQILTDNYLQVAIRDLTKNPTTEQLIGNIYSASGLSSKQTLLSYFGQANYGYRDKYFVSSSIRTDGSSLFGDNRRFGTHWSTGVGWLLTAEPFMEQILDGVSFFKIRGSVGSAGNSAAINNRLRYHQLVIASYLNGVAVYPDREAAGNPGIQWEQTLSWNAGLDLKLFKEKISFTADFYKRNTSKLIGTIQLPSATGYNDLRTNVGDLKNNGIELSISTDLVKIKSFRWNLTGNWSMNKNKLIKSSYSLEAANGLSVITTSTLVANGEGKNYNSFYLVQWAGVNPATGKPQWIDSLGNANSNYAAAKPSFVGKPQPDGFGSVSQSFTWKGIELSMMFNYQYGFQVYHPYLVNDGLDPFINQGKLALDRWQKPGDLASNPRRLLFGNLSGASDGGTNNSTRYLLDGDFIRLSNLSVSYQFPRRILDRLKVSSCRIYLQGNNLGLWTKYTGRQDPENVSFLGVASSMYPLQRSYSIGLNLSF